MLVQTTQSMEVLDKVDVDQMVDSWQPAFGVRGKVIRADSPPTWPGSASSGPKPKAAQMQQNNRRS